MQSALAKIPAEDEALRSEVRAFLREWLRGVPAVVRARSWMGHDASFTRELGRRGWLGLTLPTELGGGGRSAFARYVVVEELLSAGAPVAAHWIAERQTAPLVARFGTQAQKDLIVRGICAGTLSVCIGMSEPNAGSDLASVRTRAEPTELGWRLSGSKIWTTFAHESDYMVALVRTSGTSADRQAGLSQVLIDMRRPGVSVRPIKDAAGDTHFAEVHFDAVELPGDALLGEEGQGWAQVNAELGFERSGPERLFSSIVLMDAWLEFARTTGLAAEGEAQIAGRWLAQLATLRQMSIDVTAKVDAGENPVFEATIVKDLGTSFEQSVGEMVADHLGGLGSETPVPQGLLATLDYVLTMSPTFSLRGGTREILRGIIARGLGLR